MNRLHLCTLDINLQDYAQLVWINEKKSFFEIFLSKSDHDIKLQKWTRSEKGGIKRVISSVHPTGVKFPGS